MSNVIDNILRFVCDEVFFIILQLSFLLLWLNAERIEKGWFIKKAGIGIKVKRGEETFKHFEVVFGFTSLVMIEIIAAAQFLNGFKVVLMFINIAILVRLSFFNSWYRNKIVGLIVRAKKKEEFAKGAMGGS